VRAFVWHGVGRTPPLDGTESPPPQVVDGMSGGGGVTLVTRGVGCDPETLLLVVLGCAIHIPWCRELNDIMSMC
jgi:hypothetical protein